MPINISWEKKFMGERKFNNASGKPRELQTLIAVAKIEAVREFSEALENAIAEEISKIDSAKHISSVLDYNKKLGLKASLQIMLTTMPKFTEQKSPTAYTLTNGELLNGNRAICRFIGAQFSPDVKGGGWFLGERRLFETIVMANFHADMEELRTVIEKLRLRIKLFPEKCMAWWESTYLLQPDVYQKDITLVWRAVVKLLAKMDAEKTINAYAEATTN